MEDLSGEYGKLGGDPVTSLSPSSMSGGNRTSQTARQTMTAPGGVPIDPQPPEDRYGDPTIDATAYDTPVLRGPDGHHVHPDNATRTSPYTEESGGWKSAPRPSWGPS